MKRIGMQNAAEYVHVCVVVHLQCHRTIIPYILKVNAATANQMAKKFVFSDPVLQSVSTVQQSEYKSQCKGIVCNFFTQRFLDANHFMKTLQPQRKAPIIRNSG